MQSSETSNDFTFRMKMDPLILYEMIQKQNISKEEYVLLMSSTNKLYENKREDNEEVYDEEESKIININHVDFIEEEIKDQLCYDEENAETNLTDNGINKMLEKKINKTIRKVAGICYKCGESANTRHSTLCKYCRNRKHLETLQKYKCTVCGGNKSGKKCKKCFKCAGRLSLICLPHKCHPDKPYYEKDCVTNAIKYITEIN